MRAGGSGYDDFDAQRGPGRHPGRSRPGVRRSWTILLHLTEGRQRAGGRGGGTKRRLGELASRASSQSKEMLGFAHIPTGTTTDNGFYI